MLSVRDLSIVFNTYDGPVTAVNHLSFDVKSGMSFGIAGESGSGKTQTMLSLLGLLEPNASISGSIVFDDIDLLSLSPQALNSIRSQRISIVFQDPMTSLNPFLTIGSQLTEGLIYHKQFSRRDAFNRAVELLDLVQLNHPKTLMKRYPHELSGGMKQRVCIAMALLCEPSLLIADEATTALDVVIQHDILTLLNDLKEKLNMTIIMITHDLAVISTCCDEVMLMQNGEKKEIGPVSSVFSSPKHDYTKHLLAAIPKLDLHPKQPTTLSTPAKKPLLSIQNLSVHYTSEPSFLAKASTVKAVNSVSFDVFEGTTVGIVGESGCGKSTLAKTLMGLIKPSSGTIHYKDSAIDILIKQRRYQRDVHIIFQDPLASLNPRMTIGHSIAEPLLVFEPHLSQQDRRSRVDKLLLDVGLSPDMINRYPHEFSGGQCQRINIARSIISNPTVLICDEPVSALDVSIQAQIIDLLTALKTKFKLTMLFISHDLSVVQHICDSVIVMYNGSLVEQNSTHQLYCNPQQSYTKKLLNSVLTL